MKRLLLILISVLSVNMILAQNCTPDFSYTNPGVYPDSATNLAVAYVGVPYQETITTVTPSDTCVVILFPPCETVPIDSVMVESVTGLPPGLSVVSENETSLPFKFLGGSTSCMFISGTPTQAGHYPITVNGTSWATVFTLPQSQPFIVDYYFIDVIDPTGIAEVNENEFTVAQNSPNPVRDYTFIEYYLPKSATVNILIRNILGEVVWNENKISNQGTNRLKIDASSFSNGVYFYQVNYNNQSISKKIVVSK